MAGTHETQSALADIDRKLRELQQQLTHVSEAAPSRATTRGGDVGRTASESEQAGNAPATGAAPPSRRRQTSPEGSELIGQAGALAAQLERHIGVLQGLQEELERSTATLAQAFGTHSSAPTAEPLFQGVVTIDVGPFSDIGTLGTLEHGLADLELVDDVHVRSYEGSRALIQLRLDSPVQLIEEMRRAVPFRFEVTSIDEQHLAMDLHA